MTAAFDPSTDFETVVDGLEAATLQVAGQADQPVDNAHRNQVREQEADASAGDVKLGDTIWQWPVAETPARPPLGSALVDGQGNRWTILRLDEQVLGSKWSATCRDLAVEARLDTLVTIQRAAYAKDAAGEAIPTWSDLHTGVRAKVQPTSQTPEVEADADVTDRQYEIILADDLAVVPGGDTRIVDSQDRVYRIDDYRRPERIDVLPVVAVTRIDAAS